MKSYYGLVFRYLRHQKKRALLTATGIALSVALMTFILLFMHNLKEIQLQTAERLFGTYHVKFAVVNEEQDLALSLHQQIQEKNALNRVKVSWPELHKAQVDFIAMDLPPTLLPISFLQGRAPELPDELVLTEWALQALKLDSRLGQTIVVGERPYKLVGIMNNPRNSWITGRIAALVHPEGLNQLAVSGAKEKSVYIRYKEKVTRTTDGMYAQTAKLRGQLGIEKDKSNHNDELVETLEQYRQKDIPSLVVILINAMASIIAIYNMFHISVLEKMKQYGILRAIGMNSSQLRRLVLGEALLLSMFSIPIGLFIGWGTLHAATSWIYTNESPIVISTPWMYLAIAAVIGLITVLISAFKPAVYAGRTSPLKALRVASDGGGDPTQAGVAGNKLYYKWLGISGHLAYRNLKRSRSRFIVTVLSMSIAVVLFIGVHYFVSVQDPAASIRHQFLWDSEYYLYAGSNREGRGFQEENLEAIRRIPGVKEAFPTSYSYGYTFLKGEQLSPEFHTILDTEQHELDNPYARPGYLTSLMKYYFYPDDILEKAKAYVIEGRIDLDALAKGKEILIIQSGEQPKVGLKPGDVMEVGYTELVDGPKNDNWNFASNRTTVAVGAILKRFPQHGIFSEGIHVVGHRDDYARFSGSTLYRKIDVRLEPAANRAAVEESLRSIAQTARGQFVSFEEKMHNIAKDFDQVSRLLVAFIVIIAVIGALSIFNTMMTQLYLRTKEFGVMRAIGMSERQLSRMIRMEGIIYTLHSGLWGSLIGMGTTYGIYRYVSIELPGMITSWHIPWLSAVLACIGTCAMILLSIWFPLKRLRRMAIVDSVRYTD